MRGEGLTRHHPAPSRSVADSGVLCRQVVDRAVCSLRGIRSAPTTLDRLATARRGTPDSRDRQRARAARAGQRRGALAAESAVPTRRRRGRYPRRAASITGRIDPRESGILHGLDRRHHDSARKRIVAAAQRFADLIPRRSAKRRKPNGPPGCLVTNRIGVLRAPTALTPVRSGANDRNTVSAGTPGSRRRRTARRRRGSSSSAAAFPRTRCLRCRQVAR